MKTLKNIILITIPTLLILFIILELFFRFVIPASNPPLTVYNHEEQLTHYSNNKPRGVVTVGKFAEIRSKWTINNSGWNYPIDYLNAREVKPLIAVIGDSFIESFHVDSDESYPFLLRERMYPEKEVYAFGMGGIPLSQYFQINRYVNKNFNPETVIFNLTHSDFEESFKKYFYRRDIWQIAEADSTYSIVPPDINNISPTSTFWKKALYRSAIFRYLHRNLYIFNLLNQDKDVEVEANSRVVGDINKQSDIIEGTDFLFSEIKAENTGKRVIFIFDAPRYKIYDGTLETSKEKWKYEMVKSLCNKYEFEFIDLTVPMQQDYLKNNTKFNSVVDHHWNEYGHQFVANLLYDYLKTNNLN
jgi:hypothetical protein